MRHSTSQGALVSALLIMVFFKLVPAVSLWEVAEGRAIDEARAKMVRIGRHLVERGRRGRARLSRRPSRVRP